MNIPQEPKKILDISGYDWIKGQSIQEGLSVDGTFQVMENFDPFEQMGFFCPAKTPVQVDGTTITTAVHSGLASAVGGTGYVFLLGNRASAGAKCLYRVKTSDNTVVDYSAQVANATLLRSGLGLFQSRLIYYDQNNGNILSNTFPTPVLGSETVIHSSPAINSQPFYPRFVIGPDGYMYWSSGNTTIGKLVTATGTGGNVANYATVQSDLSTKDICSDGTYLVILADDNISNVSNISSQCKVYFWDVSNASKTTADIIWDIPAEYIISCRYIRGRVMVIASNGIWECSASSSPTLVRPLSTGQLPNNPYQVTVSKETLHWISSTTSRTWAYGALVGKPILYEPRTVSSSDNLGTLLVASGTYFYAGLDAGTNTPKTYVLNSGSARENASLSTANKQLPQPYRLSHAKVVLKTPLSTGQSVTVFLFDSNGTTFMSGQTKSFAEYGAKKTLIFENFSPSASTTHIEDLYATITTVSGVIVSRFSVYGVPLDDFSQAI